MKNDSYICIIILNYNGCSDTIECLSSLLDLDCNYFNVVVIDNCSVDNSVEGIIKWANKKYIVKTCNNDVAKKSIFECSLDFDKKGSKEIPELLIVKNSDNVGFAAGCNIGIHLALTNDAEYVWLLNNDTIVTANSLSVLSRYLHDNPLCQVATPQIRLYDLPDRIWNCGGQLKWYGIRKYFFVNKPVAALPKKKVINVSFVTGCAPLIRSSLLKSLGGFTEKFFFGEEDFEFCIRAKKAHAKMVCCLDSVIYHKVGSSIDKASRGYDIGKTYVYYLNRFIDVRNHMPQLFWHGWRFLYVVFIYFLLNRQFDYDSVVCLRFIRKLLNDSSALDVVDKAAFHNILDSNLEYFKKP